MRPDRAQALAWEERRALPVALATFAAVGLIAAAIVVAGQIGGNSGESELLRDVDAHQGAQLASSILQALGIGLLAAPLYYLFRAALARSGEAMRAQLVGVVVAAPLFLAVLAILSGVSNLHAASDFVAHEVPRLMAKGVHLGSDRANEVASDTIADAPLRPLALGFEFGGRIGFVVAMVYTALHAMRVGLLTRFWGSLGMALGAVSFIFPQFVFLWFIYLGLLIAGWVPGGRPPAWATGEAIPWPTPGEKAAAELGSDDSDSSADEGGPR